MPNQVYINTVPAVETTFFHEVNSVGALVKTIAIPTFAVQGSTIGFVYARLLHIPSYPCDLMPSKSYQALCNLPKGTTIGEFIQLLNSICLNGHICYTKYGSTRGAYFASANAISQLPDLNDCKIPIVHLAIATGKGTPSEASACQGFYARPGYIHLTNKKISIILEDSNSSQAFDRLRAEGGLYQIMA